LKKPNCEKKLIKSIKILKKTDFWFYKPETEKTEPNRKQNRAKPEKTEPNWCEPVFVLENRTELKSVGLNRFRFFKKQKF
jgi:hypothetical protein